MRLYHLGKKVPSYISTSLTEAARGGDLALVKRLLREDWSSIEEAEDYNEESEHLLLVAADGGHLPVVQWLLPRDTFRGFKPNNPNWRESAPEEENIHTHTPPPHIYTCGRGGCMGGAGVRIYVCAYVYVCVCMRVCVL